MKEDDRRLAWAEILFLVLLAAGLVFAGNDLVSLWDRDEPRYAETARQMARSGDWIVPYFNGDFRFQKPVLTYWVVAFFYKAFGETLFAARFASGASIVAATLIVCSLGNRMFRRPAGILSALVFLLCPITLFLGKLCIPDGLQLLFSCTAFWALWQVMDDEPTSKARYAFVFWLAIGFAILTKGPVIPGMAAATAAVYCLLTRRRPWQIPLRWGVGALVLAAVTLPWFVAIYCTAGDAFYSEAVGKQIGGRISQSFDGRLLPPGYYAGTLLLGFAPWIALALHAIIRWRSGWRTEGPFAFLLAWAIGPMILLELFRSKQIHYYAPAYPAFALLAGGYAASVVREQVEWVRGKHAAAFNACWLCLNLIVAAAFFAVALFGPETSRTACLVVGTIQTLGSFASTAVFWKRKPLQAVAVQSAFLVIVWTAVGVVMLPHMESVRVLPTISAQLAELQQQRNAPIRLHQIIEPSLVYYSGLELPISFDDDEYLMMMNAAGRETITLLSEDSLRRLSPRLAGKVTVVKSYQGWVKMHSDTVHLCVFEPGEIEFADRDSQSDPVH